MRPKTFSIATLGCRVNQYEAEQLATLLRSRGLTEAGDNAADLRLVHTCSVTVQAAGKSRQTARRLAEPIAGQPRVSLNVLPFHTVERPTIDLTVPAQVPVAPRLVLTGCWATSDPAAARAMPGVHAIITHHDDVAAELDRLLDAWQDELGTQGDDENNVAGNTNTSDSAGQSGGNDTLLNRPPAAQRVNGKIDVSATPGSFAGSEPLPPSTPRRQGFATLPLLDQPQAGRRRALLKIQDGCDAHCTYCIIPQLRPKLWSKPVDDAVDEAQRLVDGGHLEIVLTGIFLGAFGQATALRRRQGIRRSPLADLVDALCTRVRGLRRLRLSSLEPGDLNGDLLSALRSHEQVVPHFHLPLQSGSDRLLRKMNRQYTRTDFLTMVDQVQAAFDRPALTTDVIAGFPGEDDAAFADTADVVKRAGFIHVHAFHFSPRPRTAAARWQKDFVRGPVVGQRVDHLRAIADENSLAFRRSFLGEVVELLVEQDGQSAPGSNLHHGRCERYFEVWFEDPTTQPGDFARVRVTDVTPTRTRGDVTGGMPASFSCR